MSGSYWVAKRNQRRRPRSLSSEGGREQRQEGRKLPIMLAFRSNHNFIIAVVAMSVFTVSFCVPISLDKVLTDIAGHVPLWFGASSVGAGPCSSQDLTAGIADRPGISLRIGGAHWNFAG